MSNAQRKSEGVNPLCYSMLQTSARETIQGVEQWREITLSEKEEAFQLDNSVIVFLH